MPSLRFSAALLALALLGCTRSFSGMDGGPSGADGAPADAWDDTFPPWIWDAGTRTEPLRFENADVPVRVAVGSSGEVFFDTNALSWESVDFEVSELPEFADHYGYGIRLQPWDEHHQGEYVVDVVARIGEERAEATYRFAVVSGSDPPPTGNAGPMWLPQPDLFELYPPYEWRGTDGWPIVPSATVDATVCDEEGHVITLEIEVVADGASLRERATHAATATPVPYFGTGDLCAMFRIPLTGLADGRYRFYAHAVDELGAEDPYGWVHFRDFELRAE